jgi:membrane protein implicated in regulation of membrane protease activity
VERRQGWQRLSLDLLLLAGFGLVMAQLGPYRTVDAPELLRTAYWLVAVLGSGLAGIAADQALGPRVRGFWKRILIVSLVITPPVTLFVYALNAVMLDLPRRPWLLPQLAWQVLVVMLLIMTLRALLWRRVVETRTIVVPPLPENERIFRLRLSAKRRAARLIAIEAEDHYVRVHTDAGSELLSMRFAEAIEELAQVHGYRLHRSWWASADAIEGLRWNRGSGEARLAGGIIAPVSRSYASALKQAGWR